MEISDFPTMQKDFLTRISESSARLAETWAEVVTATAGKDAPGAYDRSAFGRINLLSFQGIDNSPSNAVRFWQMIDSAAKDLPELMKRRHDRATVASIRDKWLREYRRIVREMFGLPPRSETEQFLDQWRTSLRNLSGSASRFDGGLFPNVSALVSLMESLFIPRAVPGTGVLNAWVEQYEKTFGRMFRLPEGRLTREFEDRVTRAMDAQITFLESLPEFLERVVSAAGKGMDEVIKRVISLRDEQLGPEAYQLFHKTWIDAHERALVDLFRSQGFVQAVLDTVDRGVEARKKLDGLVTEGLALWNVPSRTEVESLREEVRLLKEHMATLEKEIGILKAERVRREDGEASTTALAESRHQDSE